MNNSLNYILLNGFSGTPLPYLPSNDSIIKIVLLLGFFTIIFTLNKSKRVLISLGENFKSSKEHTSILSAITNSEILSLLLLVLQATAIIGILLLIYFTNNESSVLSNITTTQFIGISSSLLVGYLFIKWIVYSIIGWVFEKKRETAIWIESYSTCIYLISLILYPITLFIVFYNPPTVTIVYVLGFFLIIKKVLILFKGLKLFSKNIWDHILLFLYFCAFEIIPCLLLYKCISNYINVLTFNI